MTEEERDELRRREVEAQERIARNTAVTPRTFSDWWHGVPVGQEYMREHYKSRHMRMKW